jgi:hypothetical protein
MDPLSIAASAAGLASLLFQLFAGCVQGFTILSTAHNLGKDASTIVCMLNIQEAHLTEWGRRAGLLTGDGQLDKRLNAPVVAQTLQMLRGLLLDTKQLKERYKLDLVEKPATAQLQLPDVQTLTLSDAEKVFTGISNQTRQEVLFRARLIQNKTAFPKRLWWAAVDKEKIGQLVDKIQVFVRELWFLLDPWRQDDLLHTTQSIVSNMVTLNDKFDQLKSLNEALTGLGDMKTETGSSSCFKSLAVAADIKAARIVLQADEDMSYPAIANTSAVPRRQDFLGDLERLSRLKLRDFKPMKNYEAMGAARYDEETVFVEWKAINPQLRSKILPRAENLAALLNRPKDISFRSLHCRGIIELDDKVAFVLRHPSPYMEDLPKSLKDLFGVKDGIEPPSLTDRIQLALNIAQSIRSFHRTGWLHKDLRSENILFFSAREGPDIKTAESKISNPILAGFSFARFASPSEISEQPSADPKRDIYRHPSAMGEPSVSFDMMMDVYSLGTILVEIAEWRALKYIVQGVVNVDEDTVPLSKLAQVKPFLLSGTGKGGTSKLRMRMGDIYYKACMMCLSGELEKPKGPNDTETYSTPGLLDVVIRDLERCRV